ncbi:MAG: UDP-N-acetylmuramate:L-alanyl-gamma-D-glutamyl-meso-diaminopimelate ligase [Gammaproteobacteria bacterium]
MKVFIAGICGTFMAGIAQIAKSLGHQVTGCDANVYPPMSEVLAAADIPVKLDYLPQHIDDDCDCVVIGNALSRGNPLVEHVLDHKLPYLSGPAWLAQNVLRHKRVIAIAGTHGKTSTSSMLAWILEQQQQSPGFLIGGKPGNFSESARIGGGDDFVIEADEYDTAFFDKRSKFVHYCPDIAVLNNLEFDHADIFENIDQIKKQFHYLVRIVPARGNIIYNQDDDNIRQVMAMGCWSNCETFSLNDTGATWSVGETASDASQFDVFKHGEKIGEVDWNCIGRHNMANALAAISAASQSGIRPALACEALSGFIPNARRLQHLCERDHIILYEDFAHHPTAVLHTLEALRSAHPCARLVAIIEPRSNTMRMGCHGNLLGEAIKDADQIIFYAPQDLSWNPEQLQTSTPLERCRTPDEVIALIDKLTGPTVLVAMSNGSFDGVPNKIQAYLESR